MRPYLTVLGARFRTLLQYRAAALAGVTTQLFFGYIRMMIFDGFYRSSSAPQPMTREQTIGYIWLGQAMLGLVMFGAEADIAGMIRSGTVAYELARPVDLYGLWYMRCVSAQAATLALRAMPILVLAGLFFGLQAPPTMAAGALFIVSILAAVLLSAAIVALITISLMWTISGEGVSRLAPALIFFFSGMLVPLPLFPNWMQPLLNALPFRGLIDVPFRIYLGNLAVREAAIGLIGQVVWIGVLIVIGRWALSRGMRRLVVQGG